MTDEQIITKEKIMAEIKTEKNGLATYKYVYKNPRPTDNKVDVEMFQEQIKRKFSRGGTTAGKK
jgi:hypothetical protein